MIWTLNYMNLDICRICHPKAVWCIFFSSGHWTFPRISLIHHSDGQQILVCCSSWGRKDSDTTEQLNWTDIHLNASVSSSFLKHTSVDTESMDDSTFLSPLKNIVSISSGFLDFEENSIIWIEIALLKIFHLSLSISCQCRRYRRPGFYPKVRKIPWSRKWQPTLIFLPGEFHEQRSPVGFSLEGCKQLDTTDHTHACMCVFFLSFFCFSRI